MRNTEAAFLWVVEILNRHNIPFQVTGGFAAQLYGAKRELNDIDLDVPEDRFDEIIPDVQKFITFGPAQYKSENWDLLLMKLLYDGQEVDINGAYKGKTFDMNKAVWVDSVSDFSTSKTMTVYGISVPVVNKQELIEYKKAVARDTDLIDVEYIA